MTYHCAFPRGCLFLDLETCGFAGSPLFLVGLAGAPETSRGHLVVEQLLARDYTEEPAVLHSLWQRVLACQLLITFNGRSFDWPLVHDRSTFHRLGRDERGCRRLGPWPWPDAPPAQPSDPRPEPAHWDLLHAARRRWRGQLPDCRLQTLERMICRRSRCDDLPGREVPAAYHRFVRGGDPRELVAILRHNAEDLITLVELAAVLSRVPRALAA